MLIIENTKTPAKVTGSNIGRFEIPAHYFETPEGLQALTFLFDGMLVLRCERRTSPTSFGDVYDYMAIRPGFAVVPQGAEVPFYRAKIKCVDNIPESISWENDTVNKVVARMTENVEEGVPVEECEPVHVPKPRRRAVKAEKAPF